jgi:hypothetical protein
MRLRRLASAAAWAMVFASVVNAGCSYLVFGKKEEVEWLAIILGLGFAHAITLWVVSALRDRISTWAVFSTSIFGLLLATVLFFVGFAEYFSRDERSYFSLFALVPALMIVVFAVSIMILLIGAAARSIFNLTKPSNRFLLRACFIAFFSFFVGGLILTAGGFAVSFFQTGMRAEYTRVVSLAPLAVLSALGLLRAIWIYVAYRLNDRGSSDLNSR